MALASQFSIYENRTGVIYLFIVGVNFCSRNSGIPVLYSHTILSIFLK